MQELQILVQAGGLGIAFLLILLLFRERNNFLESYKQLVDDFRKLVENHLHENAKVMTELTEAVRQMREFLYRLCNHNNKKRAHQKSSKHKK